ncbi:MAG: hypothetical protein HZA90_26535 [Verrucomicrobia bacterium]|nr:hypothetical protein [Verrucomicrobiota bacterium]
MASKQAITQSITDADKIIKVWTDNAAFKMDKITLEEFTAKRNALEQLDQDIAAKEIEMTGLVNTRKTLRDEVSGLTTRARSGIRGFFGPDSTQYEQAGGTRTSERKKPVRKAKTGDDGK